MELGQRFVQLVRSAGGPYGELVDVDRADQQLPERVVLDCARKTREALNGVRETVIQGLESEHLADLDVEVLGDLCVELRTSGGGRDGPGGLKGVARSLG